VITKQEQAEEKDATMSSEETTHTETGHHEDPMEPIEVRVLGALIEKELTTPEYYPLSLNALVAACNQKSNREPVMSLDQTAVDVALSCLRQRGMVVKVSADDARVSKYRQTWTAREDLTRAETAVISTLMLRGPQTLGELRGRSSRIHDFKDLGQVERILESLEQRETPLVMRLPRQAGYKESRYAQLLGGRVRAEDLDGEDSDAPPTTSALSEQVQRLETEIYGLRTEINELKQAFRELKEQLGS